MSFSARVTPWITTILLIAAGRADDAPHWAYVAPLRPVLPPVAGERWVANPVDLFVLAKIGEAGLSPSPPADSATRARRLYLDATGVPPTWDELDSFLADQEPGAWERLVERVLASPRFGERMAQLWLDAARYADTHGYLIDSHRDMWRWRDGVIESFNANVPFDRFTVEQLAGDLLPGATLPQRLASGFHRNHMINFENGALPEQYRAEYVADRVATTATVWLGQTLHCARCHDHKHDPFTMVDFYRFAAFFNSVAEEGLDGKYGNAAPLIRAPTAGQQQRLADLELRIAEVAERLDGRRRLAADSLVRWEDAAAARLPAAYPEPAWRVAFDTREGDDTPLTGARAAGGPARGVSLRPVDRLVSTGSGQALLCNGRTQLPTPVLSLGPPAASVSVGMEVFPTASERMVLVEFRSSAGNHSLRWELHGDRLEVKAWSVQADRALHVRSQHGVRLRTWQRLLLSWDGGAGGGRFRIDVDGRALPLEILSDRLHQPLDWTGVWHLGGREEESGFRGMIDTLEIFSPALAPTEATAFGGRQALAALLSVPRTRRTPEQQERLQEYFLATEDVEFRRLAEEHAVLVRQREDLYRSAPTAMVMEDLPEARPTHVLRGGAFDAPGERVFPGTPLALPPLTGDAPRDRLGLARWIIAPENPLTARVTVNRFWQHFFGEGLVRTPEDFGTRGEPPSHPELLDWLAVEFLARHWDVKQLVRLLVTSTTYQQSSGMDDERRSRDPANRWLSRAARYRLDAEAIRDSALSVSGLLDQRLGGPSVFPYQPEGLWEELSYDPAEFTAQVYTPSRGRDRYRRSLYTFWKRTLPPPAMTVFDAPSRETCTVARARTSTPLQALVLMNDPTLIEAARHVAQRALDTAPPAEEARVAWCFRTVLSRWPEPQETAELVALYRRQRERLRRHPGAAEQLLAAGESGSPPRGPNDELAAWTLIAHVLLCLDEAITRN